MGWQCIEPDEARRRMQLTIMSVMARLPAVGVSSAAWVMFLRMETGTQV